MPVDRAIAEDGIHIRCPHCHQTVNVVGSGAFETIRCPACSSSFDLLPEDTAAETGPRSLGHFELIERLGAGSFGTVWKARDTELDRLVAIKVPRLDQEDRSQCEWFLHEARAAAQLHHPHIVAVHEVGRDGGSLYIVSDFVEGTTLAERLITERFTPGEAAELIALIADALHHAHEVGVIHRDLKPQNIMLDGEEQPKLMDFGLAKRESAEITMTLNGRILGTPAYMSPEQARGEGNSADRRTDIYSLGVMLFEMLTGERPFRGSVQMLVQQVIRDDAPSPRKLNSRVPRDLETICLKCMEKTPARRYATAREVAEELRRHLAGRPIHARPISRVARFGRLCRRNPITSSAIGATALTIFIALGVVSFALVQAERSLNEAIAAVNDLFTTVSENTLLNQPGMQPIREELLQKALAYYQRLLKEHANSRAIQDELGATYYRVGRITELLKSPDEALSAYQAARELQERRLAQRPHDPQQLQALGNTLNAVGNALAKKDDLAGASAAYESAVQIRQRLVAVDPKNSEYQRVLANTVMNLGLLQFNTVMSRPEGADTTRDLAHARGRIEESQKIRQAALLVDPSDVKVRRDLAKGYFNLGNLADAERDLPAAVKHYQSAATEFETLLQQPASEISDQSSLALCYRRAGDVTLPPGDARPWYQKALRYLDPIAQRNPDVTEYQVNRGALLLNLSQWESDAGNPREAEQALSPAREILELLANRFPAVPSYQRDFAIVLRELARVRKKSGNGEASDGLLHESIAIWTRLCQQYPSETEYPEHLRVAQQLLQQSP